MSGTERPRGYRVGKVLTHRQAEILGYYADGLSTMEIVEKLGCTKQSIFATWKGAQKKLGATSREQAVLLASEMGELTRPASVSVAQAEDESFIAGVAAAAVAGHEQRSRVQREKFEGLRRSGAPRGHKPLDPAIADEVIACRAEGLTWQEIADWLNDDGIPTPQGGLMWRPASVRSAAITRQKELDAQNVSDGGPDQDSEEMVPDS